MPSPRVKDILEDMIHSEWSIDSTFLEISDCALSRAHRSCIKISSTRVNAFVRSWRLISSSSPNPSVKPEPRNCTVSFALDLMFFSVFALSRVAKGWFFSSRDRKRCSTVIYHSHWTSPKRIWTGIFLLIMSNDLNSRFPPPMLKDFFVIRKILRNVIPICLAKDGRKSMPSETGFVNTSLSFEVDWIFTSTGFFRSLRSKTPERIPGKHRWTWVSKWLCIFNECSKTSVSSSSWRKKNLGKDNLRISKYFVTPCETVSNETDMWLNWFWKVAPANVSNIDWSNLTTNNSSQSKVARRSIWNSFFSWSLTLAESNTWTNRWKVSWIWIHSVVVSWTISASSEKSSMSSLIFVE